MYLFETHKEFIESSKIKPGIKYLAPEMAFPGGTEDYSNPRNSNSNASGTKVWEVLSGTPPQGERLNLFEVCKGIPNAYVKNVSMNYYLEPSEPTSDYLQKTTIDVPINTITYDDFDWYIFNGTEWKELRNTYG